VEEIFNYRSDPGETHDLIGTPAADVLLQRFRKLLETETP
jgi:hypothetical protein